MGKRIIYISQKAMCAIAEIVRILFLSLFVVALFGCNTHKKVLKQTSIQSEQTDQKKISVSRDTLYDFKYVETITDTIKKYIVYNIKVYDTEKPIDTMTHKPPLKAEIVATMSEQRNMSDLKDSVVTENIKNEYVEDVINIRKDSIYEVEQTEKSTKTKIGRDIVAAAILICILVVAAFLSKIVLKNML